MPEMMWKPDAQIDAARRLPGWREFHAACGRYWLYFDHITRTGRQYTATAFTLTGNPRRTAEKLADGRGPSPVEAIIAAYHASGIVVPGALEWFADDSDFDDLIGAAADDFEEMIG